MLGSLAKVLISLRVQALISIEGAEKVGGNSYHFRI